MLIGPYNEFVAKVKLWKKEVKTHYNNLPKKVKKQKTSATYYNNNNNNTNTNNNNNNNNKGNPLVITKKAPSFSTPAPAVTCPICNNILIGTPEENNLHASKCEAKHTAVVIRQEDQADEVMDRVCPTCDSKINGNSEYFARHVEYCIG